MMQVIQWHFWLKKNEILSQVEEWMTDLESYSSDKRVGRSIAHSSLALKVSCCFVSIFGFSFAFAAIVLMLW